jgi:hypothetical protein
VRGRRLPSIRWLKCGGFALGLAVAAAALLSWRVPGGTGTLAADVYFRSIPTGEIAATPAGDFISGSGLEPGLANALEGVLNVRNQTGRKLAVRLRAPAQHRDLDRLLRIDIAAGSTHLYRGSLGGLRRWTRAAFPLEPGESGSIRVRAWLPSRLNSGYQGRVETATVEFAARPVEPRS